MTNQATDLLNDQIRDSLDQVQKTLEESQQPFATGMAFNTISHALALALHNSVARQQHAHMLRHAMTAAATRALLDGQPEKAEAVLKLAQSELVNPSLQTEVDHLLEMVRSLRSELEKLFPPTEKKTDPAPSTAAAKRSSKPSQKPAPKKP